MPKGIVLKTESRSYILPRMPLLVVLPRVLCRYVMSGTFVRVRVQDAPNKAYMPLEEENLALW